MPDLFETLDQQELASDIDASSSQAVTPTPESGEDLFSLLEGNAPTQPQPEQVNSGTGGPLALGGGIGLGIGELAQRMGGGLAEVPAGIIQAGLDAIDTVFGDVNDSEPLAGQFADAFNEARISTGKATRASFADSMMFDAAEKAGEIIPAFFLPSFGVKQGMAIGGAEGLAQFQDDPANQSRLAAGATGTAFGGAAGLAQKTIDFFNPGRFAARGVDDVQKKAADAKALSDATGVDLKISQVLEDTGAESLEALAKTSLKGERMARAFENKQMLQAFKFLKKTERGLDPSKADFGTRVKNTFDQTANKMTNIRSAQAAKDFDAARAATGDLGVIPSNNTQAAITDILEKFDSEKVRAVPAMRTFLKNVEGLQQKFADKPSMNVKELQNLLASFGKAADGKGGFFSDVSGFDKYSTQSIHRALQADLAQASEAGVAGAGELRKARLNYEANSQVIDDLKSTTLAKLFNSKTMPPPEKIENAFASMPRSQIKASMEMLGDVDPGLQQGLQRFWLGRAISKGRDAAAALPSGEVRFDPDTVLKNLKNDDTFKAVFNDARSRGQVMEGVRVLRKLGIGTGRPSPQLVQKTREGAGVVQSLNGTFVARFLAGTMAPTAFAKALFTKEGVENLRLLAKPTSKPAAVAGAMVELEQMMESGNAQ